MPPYTATTAPDWPTRFAWTGGLSCRRPACSPCVSPRTLLINACLSAELDERRGTDPLGIPTVALCRGAETVIGGIFPLPDGRAKNPRYSHPTARILAILYRLLATGVPPSTALRSAQRQYRAEVGPVPPRLWAGLVSITTTFEDPHRT
ncbi:CHAT domain-containing protein [Streptomyces sp. NPDC048564]|uniref:CHAT domain-containing protein n=1 Tax=Streptomyces sp. NPDC048564 TaxID=3155760 RepID=UPI0034178D32